MDLLIHHRTSGPSRSTEHVDVRVRVATGADYYAPAETDAAELSSKIEINAA